MLGLTTMLCIIVNSDESYKQWIRDYYYLHYIALAFGIILLCTILCCTRHARVFPRNYILLALFTIFWSFMVAGFTQWFDPLDIVVAAVMTLCSSVGLSIFACIGRMKLTWLWGIAAGLVLTIWPLGIFCSFMRSKILEICIIFCLVILSSIYTVIETKRIMNKLNLDEHVIGALLLLGNNIKYFFLALVRCFTYISNRCKRL